jgi:hypothetical protein
MEASFSNLTANPNNWSRLPISIPAIDFGCDRQAGPLQRQCLVGFERDQDIFVAHKALARQAVSWGHVVHFGVPDFFARDLTQLRQQLLLLLGESDPASHILREMINLHQTGSALAILAIKRDGNPVRSGNRENGAAVAGDCIYGNDLRHNRQGTGNVGQELAPFFTVHAAGQLNT